MKGKLKKSLLIGALFTILLAIIVFIGYNNFSYHKDTVINQQQEHLLTIAKSISRTIDEFIEYRRNSLSILAKNTNIIESLKGDEDIDYYDDLRPILRNYGSKMGEIILYDREGQLIYQTSGSKKDIDKSIIDKVFQDKKGFLTREYLSKEHGYSLDIVEPVFSKGYEITGILVNRIDLNKLYEDLIYPIRPGEKGYAMVKNMEGYILMHTVMEQIGTESIKVRKERFPQYDWSDLEELNRKQVEEKEGYHVYNSRWWQEEEVRGLSKKINAYTTMEKDCISWIISVQMDYEEIEGPIRGYIINTFIIGFLITIILMVGLYIILRVDKKRRELEMETLYLKELNKAWDELIKSEARLRHSQKLETIGTLTNRISHEFNNLLSPILGYSEILLGSISEEDPIYDDILEINKSALRLKEIIQQLLSFSRGEDITARLQYAEINHLVDESISLIRSILPYEFKIAKNINSSELVLGNPTQLQQVLLNLYTNAYHAMDDESGVLRVNLTDVYINEDKETEPNLAKGRYVKIQVIDNGEGMDSDTLDQIFDYYFTTKEPGLGTGLGLPVVKGIVEKHRGRIFINSEIGVGTTIDIYLPAVETIGNS